MMNGFIGNINITGINEYINIVNITFLSFFLMILEIKYINENNIISGKITPSI